TKEYPPDEQAGQEAEKPLLAGSILSSRYLIQDVIGVGGMGSVYRARDMHFSNAVKLVAVKEMINHTRDPGMRQTMQINFEREANILVSLNHISIPKIYDFFEINERFYLVLEFIDGKDLEVYLGDYKGFLQEDQVIGWAIELCEVLQFLHSHKPEPIIFRDVKPSNVMVNRSDHIVLIDFGIAKVFKVGQKGTMIGTEGYAPPEQYRGESNPTVDIYAIGATLHHLLTRRDPRLEAPFTFSERPIRQINPSISTELESVINTALAYNGKDRYPSASAMKEALMAVASRKGIPMPGYAAPNRQLDNESSIKPVWTFECEDEIRATPQIDGGLAFIGVYDNNMYALDAQTGAFKWKFPTQGGIVSQPVVHEGKLLFGSEDRSVYGVEARTGKELWKIQTGGQVRSSGKVAEGHLFIGSDDGYLYAINLASNKTSWRVETQDAIRSTPFITEDHIYFGSESGELTCCDFRGSVKFRFTAKRAITSSPLVTNGRVFFGSVDSTFYGVDAKSGWTIWRFRMGKGTVSSPCTVDGLLFFGSADGNIYCVDGGNGREVWRYKTDHQISGSPIIYRDNLICGSAEGILYCLEYRSGRLRWKFQTRGPITGTPIVYNEIIYFGSVDHTLYAIPI
ncbi:MAG: serine/threonine-protein kinase, partial [Leptolinea sp.]